MITVHHLNDSRSERILWLLEELGLPYEIKFYQRDPQTRLAPPELKKVHPLGKAPVMDDEGLVIAESGAIIDHVIRKYGDGRLAPPVGSADYDAYVEWLQYAEGSAMLPLMLGLYLGQLKEAAAPLKPRVDSEIALHLGYIDKALAGRDWLVGDDLTGADIQLSFVGEISAAGKRLEPYPNITAWIDRFQARPAYKAAIAKGGAYRYAKG